MKKLLLIVLSVCFLTTIEAQIKFGIRAGISTSQVQPSDLLIRNASDAEQLNLAINDSDSVSYTHLTLPTTPYV